MNKTAISWTNRTWNPTHGCSKVSDGCKNCYAAELSLKRGWTKKPWTLQNETENVLLKPHKLSEPYGLKDPERIFVNSTSDAFHRVIPDWYRAVIFCIMLDLEHLIFQVLTKRAEETIDWHERFLVAIKSPEFIQFADEIKTQSVKKTLEKALDGAWDSPWGENVWMGTSVEDSRVLNRIDQLRQCKAKVRFVSAEPLLGPLGTDVNLEGIHWVIVGGESGLHMKEGHPRWMKQEWARELRDACLAQGVAFFYKQDSGIRTELRTALDHGDGMYYKWEQYPGTLAGPVPANKQGKPLDAAPSEMDRLYWVNRVFEQQQIARLSNAGIWMPNPPKSVDKTDPDLQQLSLL